MTRRRVRLAVLMALGIALHLVEAALALPVVLPGAKLGLANVATLVVLVELGPLEAALFGPVRHLLGSFITGTFLLPTFWLGMGGCLATSLLILAARRKIGLRTTGVLAGALFQVGQGGALVTLAGSSAVLAYVPPLLALGVAAGWVTGFLADRIVRVLGAGLEPGLGRGLHPRYGRQVDGVPAWVSPPTVDRSLPVAAILLAASLALSFTMAPHGRAGAAPRQARVLVAGQQVLTLALTEQKSLPLDVAGGQMLIETAPGKVRVLQSSCPDQVCVLTGWISRPGSTIFCAPYRVLILLEGNSSDVDGVVF